MTLGSTIELIFEGRENTYLASHEVDSFSAFLIELRVAAEKIAYIQPTAGEVNSAPENNRQEQRTMLEGQKEQFKNKAKKSLADYIINSVEEEKNKLKNEFDICETIYQDCYQYIKNLLYEFFSSCASEELRSMLDQFESTRSPERHEAPRELDQLLVVKVKKMNQAQFKNFCARNSQFLTTEAPVIIEKLNQVYQLRDCVNLHPERFVSPVDCLKEARELVNKENFKETISKNRGDFLFLFLIEKINQFINRNVATTTPPLEAKRGSSLKKEQRPYVFWKSKGSKLVDRVDKLLTPSDRHQHPQKVKNS